MKYIVSLLLVMYLWLPIWAQDEARFVQIRTTLEDLSRTYKGLKTPVEISVTGVSLQEFVRALSFNNDLNVSIDPSLNYYVYNNFSNETPINILVFLCKQYNLAIDITGTIIHLKPYDIPKLIEPIKLPQIKVNPYSKLISVDLVADTLKSVAKELSIQTKQNIILSPGTENKLITAYLVDIPLQSLLENIALVNNLDMDKSHDGSYILSALPTNNVTPSTNKISTKLKNSELSISTDSLTGISRLSLNAYNTPIIDIITICSEKLGKNYFIYSEVKGNISLSVKNIPYEQLLEKLFTNTNYTYRQENNIYLFGERNVEQIRKTTVFQFKNRSSKDIETVIPIQYKTGIEIKPFIELNSVLISGPGPQIDEIVAFLEQIDRTVPLIHLEVIIMEVRKGHNVSSGITAGISDKPVATQGTVLPGFDVTFSSGTINDFLNLFPGNKLFNLGRVSSNFYVSLKAMEDNENVKIYSTPSLSTLNGNEASLKIGEKAYYAIDQRDVIGSQNPQTVFTRRFEEISADLKITFNPFVSADSIVTMDINVEEANFTAPSISGGPPGISTRLFESMIRVKDQEMVILGGLHKSVKSDQGSGMPLLSRIPVIKWFFSNRKKEKSQSQLIIFIKPTIYY